MKRITRKITALLLLLLLLPLPLPGAFLPGDGLLTVRAEAAGAPSDGGFPSDDEITVFDTSGIAVQDLASSKVAYERAVEADLGVIATL